MDQAALTGLFCERPQNFAWFLGAGTSRSAGLPTATDILWDLKRRHYCQQENQNISRQDVQNVAVRERIQAYFEARGFPNQWDEREYTTYFEKIFGADKERQRRYIRAILSEDRVTLSVGCRVLGALFSEGYSRAAFTTNFDSVVERAVAEVSGNSLSAYHLEGPHNALAALNNEEFPLYCKLHGDFRFDSLKNLESDLATQNQALSRCLVSSANRFGLIITGYSGRDASVMKLLHEALESTNPFPHGLFWTGMMGSEVHPAVEALLDAARDHGVRAEYVEIQTYDSFMLRLWRNLETRTPEIDRKVRRKDVAQTSILLPGPGSAKPIMRLNALPVRVLPSHCQKLSLNSPKDWSDLRKARNDTKGQLLFTKSESVFAWGLETRLREIFGDDLRSVEPFELPVALDEAESLFFKGFVEEALSTALARGKPLLCRATRTGTFLICDPDAENGAVLQPLCDIVGTVSGEVRGVFSPVTDKHPRSEQVRWSEALRVRLDIRSGRHWLLIDPDIWIWPQACRKDAATFLTERRGSRFNPTYNALLDAWTRIILGTEQRNIELGFSAFDSGDEHESPVFRISTRAAYSMRFVS